MEITSDFFTMIIRALIDLTWYLSTHHVINHLYSSDHDECAVGSSGCDHVCSNTNGSFSCSCHPGYFLDSDGKTCRGGLNRIVEN